MIILFENGRLGNQLFQYAGLKYYFPEERLIFFGCESIKNCLSKCEAIFIEKFNSSLFTRFGVLSRIAKILTYCRILGCIKEIKNEFDFKLIVTRGLFWNLLIVDNCFFQHPFFFNNITNDFILLNQNLLCAAKSWLEIKTPKIDKNKLVFLHIRRGDYLSWPEQIAPAVLDKKWYQRAITQVKKSVQNPIFLILTDDFYYAQDVFGDQSDVLISDNSQSVDIALMALCSHGILSSSSFAWWGAFFSMQQSENPKGCIFIAPKYWVGHRKKQWHPKGFLTDWITYME